jgi:Tfp pilus assembly protein PilV
VEGLLAILIFSTGILATLMLLAAALVEVGNARYRSEASALTASVLADMWTGDRSLNSLQSRYGSNTSAGFAAWQDAVKARLPGVSSSVNKPQITITNKREVTVILKWKAPGDRAAHQLVTVAVITD